MTDELIELETYYNNLLLMGETEFIYKGFIINKTEHGLWQLKMFLTGDYHKNKSLLDVFNSIPTFVQVIGPHSFRGDLWENSNGTSDSHFSYITIPEGIIEIGMCAFMGCHITGIKLPSTLKHIDKSAFACCDIQDIYLPDNLEKINAYAFFNNKRLKSISLPSNIDILNGAFKDCGTKYYSKDVRLEVRAYKDNKPYIHQIGDSFQNSSFKQLAKRYEKL